ncbi:MAG: HAMP domain-containing histidine kinase [Deltaproteobacteria bacterium]|nr:HAMP domain-containing histidine kinase [Deltaproteobacteria bacterium]
MKATADSGGRPGPASASAGASKRARRVPGSPRRRTLLAAALVAVGLGAPLAAWFVTGWARTRQEVATVLAAPAERASASAQELSARLGARLEELRERESQRPYYHYQNLYHDPRGATIGSSVIPSPLAGGPDDALVRAHFQIDASGHITLPTLNDEVPELSSRDARVAAEALRRELEPEVATLLAAAPAGTDFSVVAALTPGLESAEAPPQGGPERWTVQATGPQIEVAQVDNVTEGGVDKSARVEARTRVIQELDPDAYWQNSNSNSIYQTSRRLPLPRPTSLPGMAPPDSAPQPASTRTGPDALLPPGDEEAAQPGAEVVAEVAVPATAATPPPTPTPTPVKPQVKDKARSRKKPPAPVAEAAPRIIITTDPLQWHAVEVAGVSMLVALRQVGTPDGALTQGFLVSPAALTAWLAGQGAPTARVVRQSPDLAPAAGHVALAFATGAFALDVAPAQADVASARALALATRRRFLWQFTPVAALAALLGALLVALVSRSEHHARQRSLFAASAAHELRTPLAGLAMYGEMLADGLGDPTKSRDYARRIADEAARLGRVVGNVLGFTQLERGALAVRPRVADLAECVEAAVERARPALSAAGASVKLTMPEDAADARFDPDAVAQIVHNLLDNAEKYSRDSADRSIEVSVEVGPEGGSVTVVDHGPGLPPRARRLFRPFSRAVSSNGPAGLGLGLALSRALARAQGGDLTLGAGPGARFVLSLPVG